MTDNAENNFDQPIRGEWVRLRTFIYLRWLAVFGQSGAVIAGLYLLELNLRLDLISPLILLSASINIVATLLYPENKRLSETDIFLLLLYDLIQLSALLFLTGGLTNPFAMLVLAPVTISATVLGLSSTISLGVVAACLITLLGFVYEPLLTVQGKQVDSKIILIGTWLALLITAGFIAGYVRRITIEMASMSKALLATQMALEREQKLTALGGVVAAMAHELGTPLSTIKLVAAEILNEKSIDSELKADVSLINSQVDRCRNILHDMGRHGKDDTHFNIVPIVSLIQEATEPHKKRGKTVILLGENWQASILEELKLFDQPTVVRRSEIIHGIRNLVQNAVDYSMTTVFIKVFWDEKEVSIWIVDDGPGFPPDMFGRLGDPFLRVKSNFKKVDAKTSKYEGMGLGLFIAKTLLERTGAKLLFSNGPIEDLNLVERSQKENYLSASGAIVKVIWPKSVIVIDASLNLSPLPPNKLNQV